MKEEFLQEKLMNQKQLSAFRELRVLEGLVDFCSNDYLGLSRLLAHAPSTASDLAPGSTGSRLLTGNSIAAEGLENSLAAFHDAEAALLFNSGYDANIGLLSAIVGRGDDILYDQLSHASIRDGIRLGFGNAASFRHNDTADLILKLGRCTGKEKFVVTESVFSMDGHQAPLQEIISICKQYQAHLIVDEAHALGVMGSRGEGLVQALGLHRQCLARVYTFGKAAGTHGAAILGSGVLRDFLINFSRPFIFSTAPPPAAIAAIADAYSKMPGMDMERKKLAELIRIFQESPVAFEKLKSSTPVQGVIVPGNSAVKELSAQIQCAGLDVRPILYPSVPKGTERLRIVLHSFNSRAELERLVDCLQ